MVMLKDPHAGLHHDRLALVGTSSSPSTLWKLSRHESWMDLHLEQIELEEVCEEAGESYLFVSGHFDLPEGEAVAAAVALAAEPKTPKGVLGAIFMHYASEPAVVHALRENPGVGGWLYETVVVEAIALGIPSRRL